MRAKRFIDPYEQRQMEALKLFITQFMVKGFGMTVTNFWGTPEKFLTPLQIEVKRQVGAYGYKVRLPYWVWLRRLFGPKINYETTPDYTDNGNMEI